MAKETPIQTVLEIVASKEGEELILDEAPFERRYLAEGASPRAVGETLHIQDKTQGKVRGRGLFRRRAAHRRQRQRRAPSNFRDDRSHAPQLGDAHALGRKGVGLQGQRIFYRHLKPCALRFFSR